MTLEDALRSERYTGRLTIGLYNRYNPVKFMEAHRRAMCRAGALAEAFDCNLAFFGFPFPPTLRTPVEITEWATSNTSIGEDGEYFLKVAKTGRVLVFDYPEKGGFPPQLGELIITTPAPVPGKGITWIEASKMLMKKSLLLIFGLGPKGLPKEIMTISNYHLDITGKGASLETATALGAVVALITSVARAGLIKEE